MPNALAQEDSLYLRQHADNPIEWWPWGEDALARARELDRPLFVSIGYSSCHWCHVMAHESFEDEAVARVLNDAFVPIKIDREEHPEVDAQYMTAVMLISGHGGWPMSVFALPDGRPFFAGTYFPREPRHGQPGFLDLIERVSELWRSERANLAADAERLAEGVRARSAALPPAELDPAGLATVAAASLQHHDAFVGGSVGAPKFPPHADLRLWLDLCFAGQANDEVRAALRRTLDHTAWSGLRDQLGGAFHRYTVDAGWRVPHFEQMLYDNARMLGAYAGAVALWNDEADRAVLDALVRDLGERWVTDDGWLAAAWDADDPGGEGAYYTWIPAELERVLGADDSAWAAAYWRVDRVGPVEGRSTLHPIAPPTRIGDHAAALGEPAAVWAQLERIAPVLRRERAGRAAPERDDKGIVADNGDALAGLAAARRVHPPAAELGAALAAVLRGWAEREDLPRAFYAQGTRGEGQLADWAALAYGLWRWGLEADNPADVAAAVRLAERALARFGADGWRAARGEGPLGAPPGWWDGQQPSAFALTLRLLSELAVLHGGEAWQEAAAALLHHTSGAMARGPEHSKGLWLAYARLAAGVPNVVLVGEAADPWYHEVAPASDPATPWVRPRVAAWMVAQDWAALRERAEPAARAYACRGHACKLPAASAEALAAALAEP